MIDKKNLTALELWRNVYVCGCTVRENSQNKIHYGLRKGNKNFVTFATINNN